MNGRRNVLTSSLILLGSVLVLTSVLSSIAWAKKKEKEESPDDTINLRMVRLLENHDVIYSGDTIPRRGEGVAFVPGADIVVKLNPTPDRGAESADVGVLSADGEIVVTIEIPDPICTAFNSNHFFFYDATTSELIEINTNKGTITRFDAAVTGVSNCQGMTSAGDADTLYIVDVPGGGPALVVIDMDMLAALKRKHTKRLDLSDVVDGARPRGIAFNPQDGHLYLFLPGTEEIIKLTTDGVLVDRREVQELDTSDLKSVVFARSLDRTDAWGNYSLYVVTGGTEDGVVMEWSLN